MGTSRSKTERTRSELAKEAFSQRYNCAQSVIMAFPELTDGMEEGVLKQAFGFGGGMGRLQETCGALTGAYMVIGLWKGSGTPDEERKEIINKSIQDITAGFRSEWGTTSCHDLLGLDLKTAEGQELHTSLQQREKVCEKCVISAVNYLSDLIK
jgi:C_GCAxxG_C_C family probable redox protein